MSLVVCDMQQFSIGLVVVGWRRSAVVGGLTCVDLKFEPGGEASSAGLSAFLSGSLVLHGALSGEMARSMLVVLSVNMGSLEGHGSLRPYGSLNGFGTLC
jgi:hypothetical protein